VEVSKIVAELDKEIARLREARALLGGGSPSYRGAGKKKSAAPRKRTLSAEGRRRIAEAMKKRWAERKKQASKK
jgi:hypothetical protein